MEAKTILKILGVTAVATTLFAFKKKADFSKVLEAMTYDIRNLRNLRLSGSKIFVNMDLGFHNPTPYDMTVLTAGLIKVKQIILFYKDKQIGQAFSDVTAFELPANSNYLITDIKVELLYLTLINQWLTTGFDSNIDNYKAHVVVEALGKTWVIEQ
jgi:hypothetical protein